MKVSIIIPFRDEETNVRRVLDEVISLYPTAEIIAVDDGSRDMTAHEILQHSHPYMRPIIFRRGLGQSAALYAGINNTTGEVCVTMDGDGQNDPRDISPMIQHLETTGVRMVCGYRKNRRDTYARRIAGKVANMVRKNILGDDGVRDTTCGLKAFYRTDISVLVPFNGMHRYMPALFLNAGLSVSEIPVAHRPRISGRSKYGIWDRAWRGIYDLIGVSWLKSRHLHLHKI